MKLYTLFIYFICYRYCGASIYRVNENLRKKLEAEEQNAICCQNNMDCCKKFPCFEVKTVLSDCPQNTQCNKTSFSQVVVNKAEKSEKLTDCIQKLLLSVKLTNEGPPTDKSEYIIIDHIVDPATGKKVRILNPYAVRIRQEPLTQLYDLTYERSVNAEAKEKVYNKHNISYRGCNTGPNNPTCGAVKHKGEYVPYSTGFCCSCDSDKNMRMEEAGYNDDGSEEEVHWPHHQAIPDYNKNQPEENNYKHYGFTGPDGKMVYERFQRLADKSENYQQFSGPKGGKNAIMVKLHKVISYLI